MLSHSIRSPHHVVVVRSALHRQLSSVASNERPSKLAKSPRKSANGKFDPTRILTGQTSSSIAPKTPKYVPYVPPAVVPHTLPAASISLPPPKELGWRDYFKAFRRNPFTGVADMHLEEVKREASRKHRYYEHMLAKYSEPEHIATTIDVYAITETPLCSPR